MDQDTLREKSLQLIRVTKEFLLLKKEEENSMRIVSYLMNARIVESAGGSFEESLRKDAFEYSAVSQRQRQSARN